MVVIAWATCFLFYATYLDTAPQFVAASQSLALQLEANALLATGCWGSANTNNTSSRCEWPGITCNAAGSVIEIFIGFGHFYLGEMSKLNLSSFPNLVRLDLPGTRLQRSILVEIGTLSKLTYIDLSHNNLTGVLHLSLTNFTQLAVFNVSHNQMIGPIPTSLSLLIHLTHLVLYTNLINGSIASEIGMLKNLAVLQLG